MLTKSLFVIFAAADPLDPPTMPVTNGGSGEGISREFIIIVGVALILAILLFLVTYLARKGRRGRSSGRSHVLYKSDPKKSEDSAGRVKIRKRSRRHPDNLPRNPTLGETGGLPPAREDEPGAPESSEPAK